MNVLLGSLIEEFILFLGYCYFENGLCGLISENSIEFQWSVGLGKILFEYIGFVFDYIMFIDKGI